MESQAHPFLSHQLKKSISFRVASNQGFLMSSDDLVTSGKFLGSGMKQENSEPD